MKNNEKWGKTQEAIFALSKDARTEMDIKELQKRIISRDSMQYKLRKQEDATIKIVNATLRLSTDNFGDYVEVMFKKRRRLNVVPLCFLVQLYNESGDSIEQKENNESAIPFDLRSFWKMPKAIELVGNLSKVLVEQKILLQNLEEECFLEKQEESVKDTLKMINSLEILPPENGKIEIHFLESKFTINTKNVKLDIIPLCKLLVKYYAQFTTCMDNTCEVFENLREKQKIYHAEGEMRRLMEQYFSSNINW